MRIIALTLVGVVVGAYGCNRSGSQHLTPEQARQLRAAHDATVASCERLLGRPLTNEEKGCIHDEFKDGELVGSVAPPLSDTLKARQAHLLNQSPSTSPAADSAAMSKYSYVACDGGPHLLLPAALAGAWSGAPSPAAVLNPASDYGRACAAAAHAQMAAIPVGNGSALVFDNPPMSAWGTSSDGLVEVYYLKSWTDADLDALITRATAALPTASLKDSGNVFALTQPDAFLLFAGDTPTNSAYGVARVRIASGTYHVLVGTYSGKGGSITIYRLKPAKK
jgi:hypothetical protein